MSWWDKIFLALFFIIMMIVQCHWQATLMRHQRRIRHGLHALYYMLPVLIMAHIFWPNWWPVIAIALTERLAFFDPMLNIVRGKSFWYNGAGGSIQDRIENKLSTTWVKALKVFYIILFITVFIFIK